MRLIPLLPVALIGLAAPAVALTQEDVDTFLAAVAQTDCTIDANTIGPIVLATGVDQDTLNEIIVFLRDNDHLEVTSATSMRVTAGPCAG